MELRTERQAGAAQAEMIKQLQASLTEAKAEGRLAAKKATAKAVKKEKMGIELMKHEKEVTFASLFGLYHTYEKTLVFRNRSAVWSAFGGQFHRRFECDSSHSQIEFHQ